MEGDSGEGEGTSGGVGRGQGGRAMRERGR